MDKAQDALARQEKEVMFSHMIENLKKGEKGLVALHGKPTPPEITNTPVSSGILYLGCDACGMR